MATRFPLKRAMAIGLAAILIVVACLCYRRCAGNETGLQRWLRFGYMAAVNADFSKPSEYSISFEANHIDPALELEIPRDVGSRMSPRALLSGLRATSQLIDSRGEVVYSGPIPADAPRIYPPGSGRICLVEYGYSGVERHRISVTVSQPALALKGIPHRLLVISEAANRSARSAMRLLGHVALFTAAVILIVAVVMSRRRPTPESSNQGKPK